MFVVFLEVDGFFDGVAQGGEFRFQFDHFDLYFIAALKKKKHKKLLVVAGLDILLIIRQLFGK